MKPDPAAAALAAAIAEARGEPFTAKHVRGVGGGCIHTALRITSRESAHPGRPQK